MSRLERPPNIELCEYLMEKLCKMIQSGAPSSSRIFQASRGKDKGKGQVLEKKDLPREIIFNILVFIPAKILHEVVRYVCKQWYDIVTDPVFTKLHRQLAPPALLIQVPGELHQCISIESLEEDTSLFKLLGLKNTAQFQRTEIQFPFPAKLVGSCNGLVLLHDSTNPNLFHVINPLTKVKITLPPLARLDVIGEGTGFTIDSSGCYKVVHVNGTQQAEMMIFSLGTDKAWRSIDLRGVNMKSVLPCRPCIIDKWIYWFGANSISGFALDVDIEAMYQLTRPKDVIIDRYSTHFLSMEAGLGMIMKAGEDWKLWKLTDVKSCDWTEVSQIELNIGCALSKGRKVLGSRTCWWPARLFNGGFWFFQSVFEKLVLFRYDVADESTVMFMITADLLVRPTILHPYRHALLSPRNC